MTLHRAESEALKMYLDMEGAPDRHYASTDKALGLGKYSSYPSCCGKPLRWRTDPLKSALLLMGTG
jgi:hypothetical protein